MEQKRKIRSIAYVNEIDQLSAQHPVLVLGDVALDKYIFCEATRLSPEAPVPILRELSSTLSIGMAGNVANNIHTLGGSPRLIGHDTQTMCLLPCRYVSVSNARASVKTRYVVGTQHVVRIDDDVNLSNHTVNANAISDEIISSHKAIVFCDYGKGFLQEHLVFRVKSMADQKRIPTIMSIKPKEALSEDVQKHHPTWLGHHTILLNLNELYKLMGAKPVHTEKDIFRYVTESTNVLLSFLNCDNCVVRMGSLGLMLMSRLWGPFHIPATPTTVKDPCGVGDTVTAVIGLAVAAHLPVEVGCELAVQAASVVLGKYGPGTCTTEELTNKFSHT